MCHKGFIMILYVRSEDGSIQQVEVTKDLVINPASGQQFYFDDNHGDYKLSLANDDQDVNLAIDVNGTIVNIYFSDMVPLLNNSDSALAIAKNENGTQEIQDNLQNQTFSGQEILDALNAAFEENNIALVQDFGSLTNELDAAAAGGENNSDSVNFITDAKIDTFDENSLAQRDRLEVENEEVGFIDSNGVPTEETSVEADTEVSNTTTVTLGDATVNEDATTASVEVTLEGHDFKDGETVTVTLTNGDTVDFTSNGTQSATINVTADSDSIVETDATSAITASVASDAGTIENPVVNDGELTVTDSIDTTTVTLGDATVNEDATTASVEVTLEGHDFKDGETVTVTLTNGDTVDFTSNGTQSATINVTADSDSIVETDATSAITASVASDAGTIENPVVNDGELTVTDSIDTTTVTLGDATVNEDATTASVEVTLEGHDFKDGETVTVTLTNGDTVDFTSNGTQSATINVTADSDSIVETDATSAITASVASDAGTIENPVVNDGELTVTDSIDTTTVTLGDATVNEDATTASVEVTLEGHDFKDGETVTVTLTNGDNTMFFQSL